MARRFKKEKDQKHTTRDYIVFFICSFVLIFLTSSFVIENIYNNAGNIAVNQKGIKEIYLAATGQLDYNEVTGQETESSKETTDQKNTGSDQQATGNQ